MDKNELISKLQDFKQVCHDKGFIEGELYLQEAYPTVIPTSFIVNMVVNQKWLDSMLSRGRALDQLIDVLWDTTEAKTREDIFTLSIYGEDERHKIDQLQLKQSA